MPSPRPTPSPARTSGGPASSSTASATIAAEFIRTAAELWRAGPDDAVVADADAGVFVRDGGIGPFEHDGDEFVIRGTFNVPRSHRFSLVRIQAGDLTKDASSALSTPR